MPETGEWRFTYGVEIDAGQARQAAQVLRTIFAEALRDLDIGKALAAQGGAGGGMAGQIGAVKREMQALGNIDLTKPTDELRSELTRLQQQIAATEDRLQRMSFAAGSLQQPSAQQAAKLNDYYQRVAHEYGTEAANRARASGTVGSLGDITRQFVKDDQDITEFETSAYRQATEKHQFTNAEMRDVAALQDEIYTDKLAVIRAEAEIYRREKGILDETRAAMQQYGATVDEFGELDQQYRTLAQETTRLAQEEEDTIRSLATAKARVAEIDDKIATSTARAQGEIMAARKAGTGAGGVAHSQQVALTVTEASVDKAERLTAALKEAALAMQEMKAMRISGLDSDIETERAKARIRLDAAREESRLQRERVNTGAQERAAVAQQTNAQRAAQTQQTAIVRAEAAARTQAARAEATARIEGEKRQTAALKAELRERQQAARAAGMMGGGGMGAGASMALGNMGRGLILGGLGALGMYGIEGTARTLYTAGRTGAQQQRIAETFDYLAKQAGISAETMLAAIDKASRGTISDMNAISLSAQVLAQAFSRTSEDIVGDTATLVQASRRLAQVYADENGQFLTTEAVFARLIKFVREGNKELVDQFGISNQRIADSLGISIEGLRGAEGAADRFRGVIAILDEEIQRLGGATETTADKIEAAEASITDSMNRIRAALAGPTAGVATGAATYLENAITNYGLLLGAENPIEFAKIGNAITQIGKLREEMASLTAEQATLPYASQGWVLLQVRINETAAAIEEYRTVLYPAAEMTAGSMEQMRAVTADLADETDEASAATYDAAGAMAELTAELNQANPELAYLVTLANQASTSVIGLTGSVEGLTGRLSAFRGFQAQLLGALSGAAGNVRGIAGLEGALGMYQSGSADAFRYSSMLAKKQIPPELGLPPGMELTDQTTPIVMDAIEEMLTKPFDDMVEAERERKRLQDQAAREWEQAANQAERAWESAAEATVRAFENTLQSIPGVFGTSRVSEQQMKMAEWGVYQPQADEYLRQLRDEVRNKVDYAGVDIYDAARRGGIDQGLPPEAILAMFEQRWEDQSLFADKGNLDLFNQDAVRRAFEDQKKAKAGRQNILEFFGMDEDIMADLTTEFQTQLAGQQQQFTAIGGDMAKALFDGYQSSVERSQWFGPVVDTITAQVIETINAQLAAP